MVNPFKFQATPHRVPTPRLKNTALCFKHFLLQYFFFCRPTGSEWESFLLFVDATDSVIFQSIVLTPLYPPELLFLWMNVSVIKRSNIFLITIQMTRPALVFCLVLIRNVKLVALQTSAKMFDASCGADTEKHFAGAAKNVTMCSGSKIAAVFLRYFNFGADAVSDWSDSTSDAEEEL